MCAGECEWGGWVPGADQGSEQGDTGSIELRWQPFGPQGNGRARDESHHGIEQRLDSLQGLADTRAHFRECKFELPAPGDSAVAGNVDEQIFTGAFIEGGEG